jgi:hypothetical protein
VNLQADTARSTYRQATIPIDACEADVTDQAVRDLFPVLRETVQWLYLRSMTVREVAGRARITEAGVHARLWKAHAELRGWFAQRHERAAAERERVQQLSQQAIKR